MWTGATAINLGGSDAQKSDLLPKVAAGELLLALAVEEGTRHAPYTIGTKATEAGGGYTITGKKTFVLDGHVAGRLGQQRELVQRRVERGPTAQVDADQDGPRRLDGGDLEFAGGQGTAAAAAGGLRCSRPARWRGN